MNPLWNLGARRTSLWWYAWDAFRLWLGDGSMRTRRVDEILLGLDNPEIFED